jgi:DNA-binding SARP family transcriptional activator
VQISLLGSMEVRDDAGAPVDLTGTRLHMLLARLALDAGCPVTADALIDAVWGDTLPSGALNALQTVVSRLRRALPAADAARIRSLPAGYLLDDLGTPDFARATAARLSELRLTLLEDRPAPGCSPSWTR